MAVTTDVPPGQSKSIRMRGVPAGTVLAVRIVTTARVIVSLVGVKQLKEPKPDSKPVFRGTVVDKLSFRVTITEPDDYVLVLSNRGGQVAASVETEIRAVRRQPRPGPRDYSPRPEKASMFPR